MKLRERKNYVDRWLRKIHTRENNLLQPVQVCTGTLHAHSLSTPLMWNIAKKKYSVVVGELCKL